MSVTLHIDFSNGVTKTFAQVSMGLNKSVTQALDAAASLRPGLIYEFDAKNSTPSSSIAAVERFGAVTSIDGVGGEEGHVWGVWVNDRAVSDLRRVTDFSVTPFGGVSVADGDVITFKLMNMD